MGRKQHAVFGQVKADDYIRSTLIASLFHEKLKVVLVVNSSILLE